MTESSQPPPPDGDLRARAEAAEQALEAVQAEAERSLIRAELKAEAVRAGIVDLDGLKLVDLSRARLNERGEVEGATAILSALRRAKPWLFGATSSSSAVNPPAPASPKARDAMQMTEAEWRSARADLLRRR